MKGFILLEFGTNACGITAFLSYVTTNVHNPSVPVAAPSPKPYLAPTNTPARTQQTNSPFSTAAPAKPYYIPTLSPATPQPSKSPGKASTSEIFTGTYYDSTTPRSAPLPHAPRSSDLRPRPSRHYIESDASKPFHYYNYLNHYIPPSLQTSEPPVNYYSAHVEHYYSPRPLATATLLLFYDTPPPTVTSYPTVRAKGHYGYGEDPTIKPTKMPLVYYGDFYVKHPGSGSTTSLQVQWTVLLGVVICVVVLHFVDSA